MQVTKAKGHAQSWHAQMGLEAHPTPEVQALAATLPGATAGSGGSLACAVGREAGERMSLADPTCRWACTQSGCCRGCSSKGTRSIARRDAARVAVMPAAMGR